MTIRLIVGLGNPGPDYAQTRHNAGFWWLDRLAGSGGFHPESRFSGEVARIDQGRLWLLKPATFMNRSGQAVQALASFYRIAPEEILVVHDELDLPPGEARLKKGGGTGGHNGLKDIQARLGTPDFWRLRLGIGHPRQLQPRQEVIHFVLERPKPEQLSLIEEAIDRSLGVLDDLRSDQMAQAMQKLHGQKGS